MQMSKTLASDFYVSSNIYDREQQRIFANSWQIVGHRNECHPQPGFERAFGFYFANKDRAAPSLKSQIGDLEERLRDYLPEIDDLHLGKRLQFRLKANWKVAIDNYLECYHCPTAHRGFVDMIDLSTYYSSNHGLYSAHIGEAYPREGQSRKRFGGFWLWPNMTFSIGPGAPNLRVMHMQPISVSETLETIDLYFPNRELSDENLEFIDFIENQLLPEDISLVQSVAQGIRSRCFTHGPLMIDEPRSAMSEHSIKHFHDLLQRVLI